MKSLPIASLALVLALSGCSSSPSIQEQEKVINYEKCLEFQIARWEAYQDTYRSGGYNFSLTQIEKSSFASRVLECEEFLP